MHALKSRFILPALHLPLALWLLRLGYRTRVPKGDDSPYLPTARLLCQGMNAPALFFRSLDPVYLGEHFDFLPRTLLGFYTDDWFFLLGVLLVWYFTGRCIENRSKSLPWRYGPANSLIVPLLFVAGWTLCSWGVQSLTRPNYENHDPPFGPLLMLTWGTCLVVFSLFCLVGTVGGLWSRLRFTATASSQRDG